MFLTARSETESRIEGLEAGADDYISKPFEPRELVLRIKRILQRNNKNESLTIASGVNSAHFILTRNLAYLQSRQSIARHYR